MSVLTLLPLLVGACTAVAVIVHVVQRRSLAQAVCVQEVSRLSEALGAHLGRLMALNREARSLRRQLAAAERAREAARLLGPIASSVAEARVVAIRLAQVALDARQRSILIAATLTRRRGQTQFRGRLAGVRASRVRVTPEHGPALAVRPRPPTGFAPEYEEAEDFARRQTQTFTFDAVVTPNFAAGFTAKLKQRTSCATTLNKRRSRWHSLIVAARQPLNSPSSF